MDTLIDLWYAFFTLTVVFPALLGNALLIEWALFRDRYNVVDTDVQQIGVAVIAVKTTVHVIVEPSVPFVVVGAVVHGLCWWADRMLGLHL